MVARVRERALPHPLTCHQQQEREMTLRSREWESRSCPTPAAARGRIGPAPCPDNTVELTLFVGVQVADHKGMRARELTPFSSSAMWWRESWPTPHLGKRVELVLAVWVLASQSQGCENRTDLFLTVCCSG